MNAAMRDHLPPRLRNPLRLRRAILLGIALIVFVYRYRSVPPGDAPQVNSPRENPKPLSPANVPNESCAQWQGCFIAIVSHIIDGDTLDVRAAGTTRRVRLVLVDAPERDTARGPQATQQLAALCPVNSPAAVFPDLRQPRDEFGRTLGVIYCSGRNANAEMIRSGHAQLYRRYCRGSAFGKQEWARALGCRQ